MKIVIKCDCEVLQKTSQKWTWCNKKVEHICSRFRTMSLTSYPKIGNRILPILLIRENFDDVILL